VELSGWNVVPLPRSKIKIGRWHTHKGLNLDSNDLERQARHVHVEKGGYVRTTTQRCVLCWTDVFVRRVPLELGAPAQPTWPRTDKDKYPNFLPLFHFLLSRGKGVVVHWIAVSIRHLIFLIIGVTWGANAPRYICYLSEWRMCAFGVKVRERGVHVLRVG
jgi:hypothetical protein